MVGLSLMHFSKIVGISSVLNLFEKETKFGPNVLHLQIAKLARIDCTGFRVRYRDFFWIE